MTAGQVYVVRYGSRVKVGRTANLRARYGQYRRAAEVADIAFEPLFEIPMHPEADVIERAVLDRFRPAGQRHEYLADVDPAEVIAFLRELPDAPVVERVEVAEWAPRIAAAERAGVCLVTLDRYLASGRVRTRKNKITKRVQVAIDDLREFPSWKD